ncbi:Serpin domain-containing protein [Aspergillus lucknowensis]|uniref:Serpin domain-containing protein n=1 Tax=Aspergillus lucknowensis TaxID=176173 RepID=A0ABR4LYB5_9EURO
MQKSRRAMIDSVNHLGWEIVTQLCARGVPPEGTCVSALSIAIAIVMLAGGAEGTPRRQLCAKLGFQSPDNICTVLLRVLTALKGSDAIQFRSANALFAQKDNIIYADYAHYLSRLDATIDSDFPKLVDGLERINEWVSRETDGLIKDMLTRGALEGSQMVLINTLVFKAAWEGPFDPKNTVKDFPFHRADRASKVDMMFHHGQHILVNQQADYTAVRLPYTCTPRSEWSFIAYLPHEDISLNDIIPRLKSGVPMFSKIIVDTFGLPKFNLRTKDRIKDILQNLGYPLSGNFSAMGTGRNIVDNVLHCVTIILDEKGTEAAAATAIIMKRNRPRRIRSLIFDRPFVFSIVAEDLQMAVFTGVYSA